MDDPFADHYGVAPPAPAPAPAAEGPTAALSPEEGVSMPEYVHAVHFDESMTYSLSLCRPAVEPHAEIEDSDTPVQEVPTPVMFPLPPMTDVIGSQYVACPPVFLKSLLTSCIAGPAVKHRHQLPRTALVSATVPPSPKPSTTTPSKNQPSLTLPSHGVLMSLLVNASPSCNTPCPMHAAKRRQVAARPPTLSRPSRPARSQQNLLQRTR